ncbi:hypothetical protein FY528_02115 [Hymenobacter lutimineralis]|uniref:Uncharacterized protein n=1 Tax=Hymenobacter lutimineralis TaxID=2606448 RepID=A0A5D6VEY9_9BACT|nr:hypothetical protein [Hymenobacter lutimineralis]TYZ14543.1 hypothetical protein FY528_02115 [Hymenobacter lutimineralis]
MPIRVTLQEQLAEPENRLKQGLLKVAALVLIPIWLPLALLVLLGFALFFSYVLLQEKLSGAEPTPAPSPPSEPTVVWQNEHLAVLMQDYDYKDEFYQQNEAWLDAWLYEVSYEEDLTRQLLIEPPIASLHQVPVSDFVHPWADGVLLQLLEAAPGSEAGVTSWLIYVDGRTLSWHKLREIGLYALHEANPPLPDLVKGYRLNGDELTVQLTEA